MLVSTASLYCFLNCLTLLQVSSAGFYCGFYCSFYCFFVCCCFCWFLLLVSTVASAAGFYCWFILLLLLLISAAAFYCWSPPLHLRLISTATFTDGLYCCCFDCWSPLLLLLLVSAISFYCCFYAGPYCRPILLVSTVASTAVRYC